MTTPFLCHFFRVANLFRSPDYQVYGAFLPEKYTIG